MNKILTSFFNALILVPAFLIVYINAMLLYSGSTLEDHAKTKKDLVRQLTFLEDQLHHHHLGAEMQQIFPEGFVFINALYGLTWTEVAKDERPGSELYQRALSEARYAYSEINSEEARSIFHTDSEPSYGIFYAGWKNYLLANILAIQPDKNKAEYHEFLISSDEIAQTLSNPETPFPESYIESAWPADAFVAAASLKKHDELFNVIYDTVLINWKVAVQSRLDPVTGLIPHSVKAGTGKVIEGARGSSVCLMLIFLSEIDPVFALQQFNLFQKKFPLTNLGLPGTREYPEGQTGNGDIDSGPVISDMGFSGTIVSAGTYTKFGEYNAANDISACIESFGFPVSLRNEKKYIFGQLPIADAFIAWSRSLNPNKKILQKKGSNTIEKKSFILFHTSSIFILLLMLLYFFRKKISFLNTNRSARQPHTYL